MMLLIFVGGVLWYRHSQNATIAPEDITTVGRGDIVQSITVSGSLEPQRYADLSFSATQMSMGVITDVMASVGDSVKHGDVLVKLDNRVARTQMYSAWQKAHAQEALEKLARRKWNDLKPEERARWKDLSAAARTAATAATFTARKNTLVAPMDGVVSRQNAIVGQPPTAGTIVRVIDSQSLQVEALVSESDIVNISEKMSGSAVFDALSSDKKYKVVVNRIDPEATVVQDVVYYKVYFDLVDHVPSLRAGMSLDIDIVLHQKSNVLKIPRRLVNEDDNGPFVMVLQDTSTGRTAVRRSVTIGLEGDDGMVEVLSGLAANERVVKEGALGN